MDKREAYAKEAEKHKKQYERGEIYPQEIEDDYEARSTSPIEESLEQLEKEVYKMNDYLHGLFSKLKPYVNNNRLDEATKDKKVTEPTPPRSVIREKITSIKREIEKTTNEIQLIMEASEL